jgi:hypothetical protein
MVDMLRAATEAIGLEQSAVMPARGTIALDGTGVDVWWMDNALGPSLPGWQVRESYDAQDMDTGEQRTANDLVGAFRPDEVYQVAVAATVQAARRRIEAAVSWAEK